MKHLRSKTPSARSRQEAFASCSVCSSSLRSALAFAPHRIHLPHCRPPEPIRRTRARPGDRPPSRARAARRSAPKGHTPTLRLPVAARSAINLDRRTRSPGPSVAPRERHVTRASELTPHGSGAACGFKRTDAACPVRSRQQSRILEELVLRRKPYRRHLRLDLGSVATLVKCTRACSLVDGAFGRDLFHVKHAPIETRLCGIRADCNCGNCCLTISYMYCGE